MSSLRSIGAGAFLLVCFACSVTTTGSPTSPGAASSADVDRCKHSGCDKMKFFGCSSADEQAACYADCDKATANQIDLFASCAESSVCDPACRTNIVPAATSSSSGGSTSGGTGTGGTGATPSSCGTACDKIVSCSFIPVGAKDQCVSQCQSTAYQYQIDCVNSNTCDKIKTVCGDPTAGTGGSSSGGTSSGGVGDSGTDTFEIQQCQSACDSLNFFSCIDAATLQACRDKCASAVASTRDSFTTCANGAGGDCTRGTDCYTQFSK